MIDPQAFPSQRPCLLTGGEPEALHCGSKRSRFKPRVCREYPTQMDLDRSQPGLGDREGWLADLPVQLRIEPGIELRKQTTMNCVNRLHHPSGGTRANTSPVYPIAHQRLFKHDNPAVVHQPHPKIIIL